MRLLHSQRPASQGFILTEACVSLALVGLVLGVASLLLTQHARATEYFVNHRRAQLAAESCVERMRVGDLAVIDASFVDPGGITCEIRVSQAEAEWQPLRRVRVLAIADEKKRRSARYSAIAYLNPDAAPQEKGP